MWCENSAVGLCFISGFQVAKKKKSIHWQHLKLVDIKRSKEIFVACVWIFKLVILFLKINTDSFKIFFDKPIWNKEDGLRLKRKGIHAD